MTDLRINFKLNENQESFTTDNLSGFLEGVIIESSQRTDIIIRSSMGWLILHARDHEGTKYYAPRAHQIAPVQNLKHQYQFDKFLLNEPLEIIVFGLKGESVSITLRTS